jgi:ketosteroid isomerase-like protein
MSKQFLNCSKTAIARRGLLAKVLTGAVVGAGALTFPNLASAQGDPESVQTARIHDLQAAFHLAKCNQDIDLMMSLWANDAVVTFQGTDFVGKDAIRAWLLTTGSFTHHRLSLVTSFKIQIEQHGNQAFLYFECIDVGDFDQPSRFIASALYNEGTVRNINGQWQFWRMAAGPIPTLSVDQYPSA